MFNVITRANYAKLIRFKRATGPTFTSKEKKKKKNFLANTTDAFCFSLHSFFLFYLF